MARIQEGWRSVKRLIVPGFLRRALSISPGEVIRFSRPTILGPFASRLALARQLRHPEALEDRRLR